MFGQNDMVLERFHQRNFLSFVDAQAAVRLMGIRTCTEYRSLRSSGKISVNFPQSPDKTYEQWVNWPDFLGRDGYLNVSGDRKKNSVYATYEDAKRILAPFKIQGWKGWRKWRTAQRPVGIPSNPEKFYREKGWIGMNDFLSMETN